ncbi:MAG: SusE domain-containing protein [Clostridium sp.]|nr:SusE domain-containing protein [Prevotella sp.]MCM1428444.1 SusE domain-containing protein [Clostridium sp.]MCM1474909.1 SusE domain-containing protein [Muribaculaceae bacterium]
MNKLALTAALLPMMALALTGCKDDTQPRLETPKADSFELYAPAMNNYTYYLSADGTIELTTSGQPDYGVATPTQYQVQVSLTNEWKEKEDPENPGVMIPDTYYILKTVNTQSIITVKDVEMATAMCSLMGIQEPEDEALFNPNAVRVYVRVAAYVADPASLTGYVPYSYILSNVITLNSVKPYFVVPKPGELYVIGDYQGWDVKGTDTTVALIETEIGSQIYEGYINMTADQAKTGFRFYTELGDWGSDGSLPSVGAAANDGDNQSVEMDEGIYNGSCTQGKGNWSIQNFEGGWMRITVNMIDMKVTFRAEPGYVPPAE